VRYAGSCHCGDVAFEAEGDIKDLLECNCSICARKGSLLWFIPRDKFRLKFCKRCGIHPSAFASDPKGNPMAAINARSLEGIDLASLPRKTFNGKAL